MRKHILDFSQQFKRGLELAKDIEIKGNFDNVIFSGMGGSAWPAEILCAWLKPSFHWKVNRTYTLPPQADSKTLCLFISYSGNTEECLSSYKEALDKGYALAVITSGGKLKELCQKNKTPYILVPPGLVPRMATGYIFTALYSVLLKTGLIENKTEEIIVLSKSLKPSDLESQGKELAQELTKKIPLIYTSADLKVLGFIWEIKFNENSKIPAFSDHFPELGHNELEGLTHLKETKLLDKNIFHCLILKNPEGEERIQKRMNLTAKILREKGIPVTIIDLHGQTLIEKIFSCLILADWTTYYLSQEYKVSPLPTEIIEEFKEQMRN